MGEQCNYAAAAARAAAAVVAVSLLVVPKVSIDKSNHMMSEAWAPRIVG